MPICQTVIRKLYFLNITFQNQSSSIFILIILMICPLRMPQFQIFSKFLNFFNRNREEPWRKCVLNLRFRFKGVFSKREKSHFQKIPQRLFIWVKSSPSNVKIWNILFEIFPIRVIDTILNITGGMSLADNGLSIK